MAKTEIELLELREKLVQISSELNDLSGEELAFVAGGDDEGEDGFYFICTNCFARYTYQDVLEHGMYCIQCGHLLIRRSY